eukprot:Opistho-2@59284
MAVESISGTAGACTHVIFDMDGLLLDTEKFYTIVGQKIAERYGKNFEWSLKSKMMGKKALEAGRIYVEELAIPLSAEDFIKEREEQLDIMFPQCNILPGVERLVNHLKKHGIPICVATGSHRRHFDLKTQHHQHLFRLFDFIVTGDDPEIKRGKPHPDLFLVAKSRFAAQPSDGSNCLVFEDAPNGVEAAHNAGMKVVFVPDPNMSRVGVHPDAVIDTLEHFLPESFGLPPYAA